MDHVDPPGRHPGERRKVGGRGVRDCDERVCLVENAGEVAPEVVEGLVLHGVR